MTKVYKLLMFLKRRPGMTVEAFRDYYENTHRLLGESFSAGVVHYVRRYLDAPPSPPAPAQEPPFDVITEVWFDDPAVYEAVLKATSTGDLPQLIIEDEERLFDRSKSRVATVVEIASTPA